MTDNCPVTREDVNALVDNELSGRKQQKVAAHVARCDSCSRLAGQLLASREFIGARMPDVDPPIHSWKNISAALDRVDGAIASINTSPVRSRWGLVPALAACGLLFIGAALILRNSYLAPSSLADSFAKQHFAAVAMTSQHRPSGDATYDVVTPRQTAPAWKPVARWLIRTDGVVTDHTLYRLDDRSPVSEFVVPEELDLDGFERVNFAGHQYRVAVRSGVSIVGWTAGGVTYVLAGRIGPQELIYNATARRNNHTTAPGL